MGQEAGLEEWEKEDIDRWGTIRKNLNGILKEKWKNSHVVP